MELSEKIKAIREEKRIKQVEMAEKLDMEPSQYSRIEKRGDKITFEQLKQVAAALGVTIYELVAYGEPTIRPQNDVIETLERENSLLKRELSLWERENALLKKEVEIFSKTNNRLRLIEIVSTVYFSGPETALPLMQFLIEVNLDHMMSDSVFFRNEQEMLAELKQRVLMKGIFNISFMKTAEYYSINELEGMFNSMYPNVRITHLEWIKTLVAGEIE